MMQKPEIKTKVVRRTQAQFSCLISKSNFMWFWQISCSSFIILHFPSFSPSSHLHESTWELCCWTWKPHVPSDLCQVSQFSALASVLIMRRWGERGSSSNLALRSQTRQEAPLLCPNCSQAGSTPRLPHTFTPVTQDGQFIVFCAQKGPVFSFKNRPSVQSILQTGEGWTRRDDEEQEVRYRQSWAADQPRFFHWRWF